MRHINEKDIAELIRRYNEWRRIYYYAGQAEPNEPDWQNDRLYFSDGYPYPDWSAYILERDPEGQYHVLHASTERRNIPLETSRAVFSRIQDAGKYIVYEIADLLRVSLGLDSLEKKWRDAGLDPEVNKIFLSDKQAKYELRSDAKAYLIAYSGGIQPYHHILRLSYDQLDVALLEGFPESVTNRLPANPR
ncbi:hypothetical protein F0Q45_25115 [Mycobacterium simiae]|uniref:Uncharacterized protein n=1 Tax=Mycobacterium simiae TaxID=1784 RepID=A0A5B1BAK9_MYCSI|nr:hypothetical protein [Mycobacterium simiae]KAA1244119.1 hypothetical protein F0Q45_25115 [Mycobacterium simiae]